MSWRSSDQQLCAAIKTYRHVTRRKFHLGTKLLRISCLNPGKIQRGGTVTISARRFRISKQSLANRLANLGPMRAPAHWGDHLILLEAPSRPPIRSNRSTEVSLKAQGGIPQHLFLPSLETLRGLPTQRGSFISRRLHKNLPLWKALSIKRALLGEAARRRASLTPSASPKTRKRALAPGLEQEAPSHRWYMARREVTMMMTTMTTSSES